MAGDDIAVINVATTKKWSLATGFLGNKKSYTVTYQVKPPQKSQPHPQLQQSQTIIQPIKRTQSIDIPEQIRKFAELKEQGILTEEEFQTKKRELLSKDIIPLEDVLLRDV